MMAVARRATGNRLRKPRPEAGEDWDEDLEIEPEPDPEYGDFWPERDDEDDR